MKKLPAGAIPYKSRKGRIFHFNPWNFDAEPGDKMVTYDGKLYRLEESSSHCKSRYGELYPREIKPPNANMKAIIFNNKIFWVPK